MKRATITEAKGGLSALIGQTQACESGSAIECTSARAQAERVARLDPSGIA